MANKKTKRNSRAQHDTRAGHDDASIEALFDDALEQLRENGGLHGAASLEVLRTLHDADVARVSAPWARDDEVDKRLIAAAALERTMEDKEPSAPTLETIRLLAADKDEAVVLAAIRAFGAVTHWGPYQSHQIEPVAACETHVNEDVREAYAGLFARPGTSSDLAALIRMSRDPSQKVRIQVSSQLQYTIVILDDDEESQTQAGEALAPLLTDPSGWVRNNAIDGLTKLGDKRAADAIEVELGRELAELLPHLGFLMMAIIERPDRRYLPSLERWQSRIPGLEAIEEAIKACKRKRSSKPR